MVVEAVLVVAGAVCLVGAAERGLGGTGLRARVRRWAAGAYAAFVIQGPVLMTLASAIRPLDAPAEIKAPLVATAGIIVCVWLGRRLPLLSHRARAGEPVLAPPPSGFLTGRVGHSCARRHPTRSAQVVRLSPRTLTRPTVWA